MFNLNRSFLASIEGSTLSESAVTADLVLTKTPNLYELNFNLTGTVICECDVCLEEFSLPINHDFELIMKVSVTENYDDDEIIYITDKLLEFDLSQYLYESLILSIPVRKVCDLSGTKTCNQEAIAKLEQLNHLEQPEGETNPAWDKLKDILKNNH
ncbi:MAG: DUF177 domain-containing protein [Bacteroidia bacterium]|nr:DUF177 domain-containing protein [Bacteroidia bacterium]